MVRHISRQAASCAASNRRIWPRPNSRVTRGHLKSIDGKPGLHVEIEAAIGVHMLPDQRRQGAELIS